MCIIAIALNVHPRYRFVVASNRDEYFSRPTAPLAQWGGEQGIVAGRDLRGGGTWLGVNSRGRFAAVTNFRDPTQEMPNARSRGALPLALLDSAAPIEAIIETIRQNRAEFRAFNVVTCDDEVAMIYESRTDQVYRLEPGVHVVSNGSYAQPWPKCQALFQSTTNALAHAAIESACFGALADTVRAPTQCLPKTGIAHETEQALSSVFVHGLPQYGTRSSTVVLAGQSGVSITERTFATDRTPSNVAFFLNESA